MSNENDLASLIPEPERQRIEQRSQAITARVLEEANARVFETPEDRAHWIIDQVRSRVLFPDLTEPR